MTTDDRDPLEQRLRQALPTDVPDETRARHLAALDASLSPTPPRVGWRHRLGGMLAAAATALAPVGVAVAAEGTAPGDVLYPVKQVTERVHALVRDEVVLEHRVEELDVLLERGSDDASLVTAVHRGLDAAEDQPDEPELQERLAGLALEAAERVEDPGLLALDRLLTRRPPAVDRERPADRPTASPMPDVSPRTSPSEGAPIEPTPEATTSPRPTREPTTGASPPPSPSPAASEPPGDGQPLRTERHEARDAGVVFIDVYEHGIRVAGVRVADGWQHRVDRSREPEASIVGFRTDGRDIVLIARWRDGQVHVQVEERTRSEADTSNTTATRSTGGG